jgi:hypothetical protein
MTIPTTFVATTVFIVATTLAASRLPARRAARVPVVEALRLDERALRPSQLPDSIREKVLSRASPFACPISSKKRALAVTVSSKVNGDS